MDLNIRRAQEPLPVTLGSPLSSLRHRILIVGDINCTNRDVVKMLPIFLQQQSLIHGGETCGSRNDKPGLGALQHPGNLLAGECGGHERGSETGRYGPQGGRYERQTVRQLDQDNGCDVRGGAGACRREEPCVIAIEMMNGLQSGCEFESIVSHL